MIAALVVSVLINGSLVVASFPATLAGGTVTAPVDPFAKLIARRITTDAVHRRITFERDGRSLTVALGSRSAETGRSTRSLPIAPYLRDDQVIIPLAATARALGAAVYYDRASRRIEISLPAASPVASMTPDATWTAPPAPAPTATLRPTPAAKATATPIPRPRRTPILINGDDATY